MKKEGKPSFTPISHHRKVSHFFVRLGFFMWQIIATTLLISLAFSLRNMPVSHQDSTISSAKPLVLSHPPSLFIIHPNTPLSHYSSANASAIASAADTPAPIFPAPPVAAMASASFLLLSSICLLLNSSFLLSSRLCESRHESAHTTRCP